MDQCNSSRKTMKFSTFLWIYLIFFVTEMYPISTIHCCCTLNAMHPTGRPMKCSIKTSSYTHSNSCSMTLWNVGSRMFRPYLNGKISGRKQFEKVPSFQIIGYIHIFFGIFFFPLRHILFTSHPTIGWSVYFSFK